jgi:hypothetical protein
LYVLPGVLIVPHASIQNDFQATITAAKKDHLGGEFEPYLKNLLVLRDIQESDFPKDHPL